MLQGSRLQQLLNQSILPHKRGIASFVDQRSGESVLGDTS
jgi:hypothetical protein